MSPHKLVPLSILFLMVLGLPSFSSAKQGPKPGRYTAPLGVSGGVSFKIDRRSRFVTNATVRHTFTQVDSSGAESLPITAYFDSKNRRRRLAKRGGISLTFHTADGDLGIIYGKQQGRKRYRLLVQMFLSRRVQYIDPRNGELVEYDGMPSPGPLRTVARLSR